MRKIILSCPVRHTHIQNIWKVSFHSLNFARKLLFELLFAILWRRSTIDRMETLALIIVKRYGAAHRLSPTVIVHEDAGAIKPDTNGCDGSVQFR